MKNVNVMELYKNVKKSADKGWGIQEYLDNSGFEEIPDGTDDYLADVLEGVTDYLVELFEQWQEISKLSGYNQKELKYLYRIYNVFDDLGCFDEE